MPVTATSNASSSAIMARNGYGEWLVVAIGDSVFDWRNLDTFVGVSGTISNGGVTHRTIGMRGEACDKWEAWFHTYSTLDDYYTVDIIVDLTTFVIPRLLLGEPEPVAGDVYYPDSNIGRILTAWHLSQNPIDTVQRAVDRVAQTEDPDAKTVALLLAGGEDARIELPADVATRVAEQLGVGVERDAETGSSLCFYELP